MFSEVGDEGRVRGSEGRGREGKKRKVGSLRGRKSTGGRKEGSGGKGEVEVRERWR